MKQTEPIDYTINIEEDSLINMWTNKWVLEWCRKYHPEAFEQANKFITEYLKDNTTTNKDQ